MGHCAAGNDTGDDSVPINQCIEDTQMTGYPPIVYLPPGRYQLMNPIIVDQPIILRGLSAVGGAAPATLVMTSLTAMNAINVLSANVTIQDLAIEGPSSVVGDLTDSIGIGIDITLPSSPSPALNNIEIKDVAMVNVANGVLFDGASTVYCERVSVKPYDQETDQGSRFGFRGQGSGQVAEFLDCTVDESNNQYQQRTVAFDCIDSYTSFLVVQCIALAAYYGYHCNTAGNYFLLVGCWADSCEWGLLLYTGTVALIEGCRFSNSIEDGIELQSTYLGGPVSFANNAIDGSQNNGAAIFGGSTTQAISFSGGSISNSGGDGLRVGVVGLLSVSGVSIDESKSDGVHIYNTHQGTVALSAVVEQGASEYGFQVDAAATGTYVATGCSFSGDTEGPFNDGSSNS